MTHTSLSHNHVHIVIIYVYDYIKKRWFFILWPKHLYQYLVIDHYIIIVVKA